MSVFSENLGNRLTELGLSQAELARRLNLDVRRVGHYVTGIREPDIATLVRIARAVGTSTDALIGVVEPERASSEAQRTRTQILAICSALDRDQLANLHALAKALLSQQRSMPDKASEKALRRARPHKSRKAK
jgi:transcriptional regulator with XRE-family HTH domain